MIIFFGDEEHRKLHADQVVLLKQKDSKIQSFFWSANDLTILDKIPTDSRFTLIASHHGAIPAIQFASRYPHLIKQQIFLQPSLHLSFPGAPQPHPHFIPTLVIFSRHNLALGIDQLSLLAGRLFYHYTLEVSEEDDRFVATLKLLVL